MDIDMQSITSADESGYESAISTSDPLTHSCVAHSHRLGENAQTVYSDTDVLFTVDETSSDSGADSMQVTGNPLPPQTPSPLSLVGRFISSPSPVLSPALSTFQPQPILPTTSIGSQPQPPSSSPLHLFLAQSPRSMTGIDDGGSSRSASARPPPPNSPLPLAELSTPRLRPALVATLPPQSPFLAGISTPRQNPALVTSTSISMRRPLHDSPIGGIVSAPSTPQSPRPPLLMTDIAPTSPQSQISHSPLMPGGIPPSHGSTTPRPSHVPATRISVQMRPPAPGSSASVQASTSLRPPLLQSPSEPLVASASNSSSLTGSSTSTLSSPSPAGSIPLPKKRPGDNISDKCRHEEVDYSRSLRQEVHEKEAIINKLRLRVKEQNSTIQQERTYAQQHYYAQKELEHGTQRWLHDKEAEIVSLRSQIDVSHHSLMRAWINRHIGKRYIDRIVKDYRLKYPTLETLLLDNIRPKWRRYDNNLK
ncbi:hypothetical protein JVU11DRAFT_9731 [Chiua virens]|nr:hypothetical protein JVU11DRAFT_9731 [Chiua virens]